MRREILGAPTALEVITLSNGVVDPSLISYDRWNVRFVSAKRFTFVIAAIIKSRSI